MTDAPGFLGAAHTEASIEGGGVPHRDDDTTRWTPPVVGGASIEGGGVPHRDQGHPQGEGLQQHASIEGGGVPHRDV